MNVRLRTKWLWVRIMLLSLKLQMWRLFWARSSFRQTIECVFTMKLVTWHDNIIQVNVCWIRGLAPFVQFEKREKHQWRSIPFSKVAGFSWTLWAGLKEINYSKSVTCKIQLAYNNIKVNTRLLPVLCHSNTQNRIFEIH